jgi:D-glycero-alpha-D-manno-heptose-7-phosphate kinase
MGCGALAIRVPAGTFRTATVVPWSAATRAIHLRYAPEVYSLARDLAYATSCELDPPVPRSVIARAPTRIDFGGGWTDVPPYPETDGGYVCNVAIARFASVEIRESASAADGPAAVGGQAQDGGPLVAAAVRRAGLNNVAVTLQSDFPIGAGLGGSSAAGVALQGALAAWRGDGSRTDRAALAERSRDVEVLDLGVAGGRQDHYAAAFGGTLGLRFSDRVDVRRVMITDRTRADLERRAVLVYTGQSRISGDTIVAVIEAYRARERRVVSALARMKALAEEMVDALAMGDLDALGELVGEHWTHQRTLHPAIATARIDTIMERARGAGALGGKALGASGGGCVVLIATTASVERVQSAVASLGDLIPFSIDDGGLAVETRSDRVAAGGDAWP